ncbi:MAG: 2-hydroxyhepta-2,4-diene-1,7-dioate isomerase [Halobacteriovorax sp.]|nr:2-hydroxyhepta-2,4-diene-1,7-dioate isomerase [Halobacteriovorax sp.]|tara:strand:+ start:65930 stop:66934 length:1005 start_codon:yes stop_codon:yes gene_type:complete
MKICNYTYKTGYLPQKRLGIILEKENLILDPNLCWVKFFETQGHYNAKELAEHKCNSSLYQLLRNNEAPIDILNQSLELYKTLKKAGDINLIDGTSFFFEIKKDSIKLNSPMDRIETYRDFYAHEKHVKKGFEKRGEEIPPAWFEIPAYYKGPAHGFIGNDDEVLWPSYTDILDYELELGMVIGRSGKNIKEKDALKHIFGFTILNDISARDIQKKEMAVRLGPAKGKDFCSVLGPVITTFDEFNYQEPNLLMTAKINDQEWSRGHSGDAHFTWAQMIAHVSQDEWVLPSDLFGSGTVGTGCGLELDKWIKPGDKIELEVEGIGKLTNIIGKKK